MSKCFEYRKIDGENVNKSELIRSKEIIFHRNFYANNKLFEKGSWLHKPVNKVVELLRTMDIDNVQVLDLGCGVGRNSIPMAKAIMKKNGRIVCVDYLDLAIEELTLNAQAYKVEKHIEGVCSSIEDFHISESRYDYVVAVSTLEHMMNLDILTMKLKEIRDGSKIGGINYFVLNTNVSERMKESGERLEAQFEINLSDKDMYDLLNKVYKDWQVIEEKNNRYKFDIERDGHNIVLESCCVTYIVKRIR